MKGNLAKGPIDPKVEAEVLDHIKKSDEALDAYKVNITNKDKLRIPKAAEETFVTVDKGLDYMETDPKYLGPVDPVEAHNDRQLQEQAIGIRKQIAMLDEKLKNIAIAGGSDAFQAVLDYYNTAQREAAKGDARAKVIADDLGKLFKKSGDPVPGTEIPPPPAS